MRVLFYSLLCRELDLFLLESDSLSCQARISGIRIVFTTCEPSLQRENQLPNTKLLILTNLLLIAKSQSKIYIKFLKYFVKSELELIDILYNEQQLISIFLMTQNFN